MIKASSGLSDEEVERMVKDAESHADEDRKFHELVDARNQADNMIHATAKSLKELGDEVEEGEKNDIEAATEALKEAMKGNDKDAIVAKTQDLAEKSGKLAERLYAKKGAEGAGAEQAPPGGGESGPGGTGSDDEVVDAEFEEVKEDQK